MTFKPLIIILALAISLTQVIAESPEANDSTPASQKIEYSAEEAFLLAYKDSLYYRIKNWIPVFNKRIDDLKSAPDNVETRLELTKFYYNLGGLYVELSHIMGFNSKYKIPDIEKNCLKYTRLAKKTAKSILAEVGLTVRQKAQAYQYLGASEGSLGVLEFLSGNVLSALVNGFKADTHLEKALRLDPKMADPYLGLGIYRYGNSRMGGLGNLIMQGGRDKRATGLAYIQRVIDSNSITTPLATITLAWFYIAVQINPDNIGLADDHPLSITVARDRLHKLIPLLEDQYFNNPPDPSFVGNKGFTMLKAIQFILDGDYINAREQFEKILRILNFLITTKQYKVNPEQEKTIRAGIKFCDVMISASNMSAQKATKAEICKTITRQVDYLNNGGRVIEYEVEKIRDEINDIFTGQIENMFQLKCINN